MQNENKAKKYLREFRYIELNVKEHLRKLNLYQENLSQLEAAYGRATTATARLKPISVKTSPTHDGMENAIHEMIQLEKKLEEMRNGDNYHSEWLIEDTKRLAQEGRERLELVATLENPLLQLILFQCYFCHMGWHQIAVANNYSVDYMHKLHGWALQRLNAKMQ